MKFCFPIFSSDQSKKSKENIFKPERKVTCKEISFSLFVDIIAYFTCALLCFCHFVLFVYFLFLFFLEFERQCLTVRSLKIQKVVIEKSWSFI